MRPISLSIEGLRSFRKAVRIDFTNCNNQLAIVGDTGAGKSSILDAITYALYRQTTFSKQPNQELMNALAMQMRVSLTFSVRDETWTVSRALKRMPDGVVGMAPTLQHIANDGTPLELLEGVADVDLRIRELVGLDGDAFLRTVVLPQGNFARLLIADKPTERANILRQIWQTDALEAAGEVANHKATEAKDLRIRLEATACQYPEDPGRHLKALRKDRKASRKDARKARKDLGDVSVAMNALRRADDEIALCESVLSNIGGIATAPLKVRLGKIHEVDIRVAAEDRELNDRIVEIEQELAAMVTEGDGPSLAEVGATIEKLEQMRLNIARISEGSANIGRLQRQASSAQQKLIKAQQIERECQQEADAHSSEEHQIAEALESADERKTAIAMQFIACRDRRSNLAALQKELVDLGKDVETQTEQKVKLDEDVRVRLHIMEEKSAALTTAKQANFAASAAQGLHVGDDCPICAQILPPDWHTPTSADIADADVAATVANEALSEAQRKAASAQGTLGNLKSMARNAKQAVVRETEDFDAALQALQKLVPDVAGELPDEAAVLAPLEDELVQAKAAADQHASERSSLNKALMTAKVQTATARTTAKGIEPQMERAREDFTNRTKGLRRELEKLPEQFRPSVVVPDDWRSDSAVDTADLDLQRDAAKAYRAELEAKIKEREALEDERNTLQADRKKLTDRHAEEVATPLELLCTQANSHISALALEMGKLGIKLALPLSTADIAGTRRQLAELQETLDAVRKAATKRVELALEDRQAADATLAKFAKRFGVAADDRKGVRGAVTKHHEEAQLSKSQAKKAFDSFAAIIDDVRSLQALLTEVQARERALSDLKGSLKDGAFLKWLTLRRSRSLLSHASMTLQQMSADRYAFAEPKEEDSPWQVLDNDTGQARSPASLSGGEQFIASLALALGMVEMMALTGGKLESLFLDEGFGSLDRNNLDAAVEALAMVASRGRMVGVISHVRAVAEQFDNVLAVSKEEGGSQVEWLTDSQRQSMAGDALAGLLD